MNQSIWTKNTRLPKFDRLAGDVKTEVLIIGGGLCGILCAHSLQQEGIDYILVEGDRIGQGITKNTTAKITAQHGLIYNKLLQKLGEENARIYLSSNLAAVSEYERLCGDIDCDFTRKTAYTYSVSDRKKIEDEVRAVNRLGFPAEFCERTDLPFKTEGAICFPDQAQFDPLKFAASIAKDLNIYENTFIQDISPNIAVSENGRITAEKIIVTTHFPFINKHGSYFLKLYQHRSYVAAFADGPDVNGMYVDEADKGMSFRNHSGLLLIAAVDTGQESREEAGTKYMNLQKSIIRRQKRNTHGQPRIV